MAEVGGGETGEEVDEPEDETPLVFLSEGSELMTLMLALFDSAVGLFVVLLFLCPAAALAEEAALFSLLLLRLLGELLPELPTLPFLPSASKLPLLFFESVPFAFASLERGSAEVVFSWTLGLLIASTSVLSLMMSVSDPEVIVVVLEVLIAEELAVFVFVVVVLFTIVVVGLVVVLLLFEEFVGLPVFPPLVLRILGGT